MRESVNAKDRALRTRVLSSLIGDLSICFCLMLDQRNKKGRECSRPFSLLPCFSDHGKPGPV